MEVKLKKVKRNCFDEFYSKCIDSFVRGIDPFFDEQELENISDPIVINGKEVTINIDFDSYLSVIKSPDSQAHKKAKVSYKLAKDFESFDGEKIPVNILYDKYLWTYLNLKYFSCLIDELFFEDEKNKMSRFDRYYFNIQDGFFDRLGLWFLWYFGYVLDAKESRIITAFEFIDPVKAVFERNMAKNYKVIRAFVDAIEVNNKDSKLKAKYNRTVIPKAYNAMASVTVLDSIEYEELVKVTADFQRFMLNEVK